ncbi:MAG: FIST N-terminal domain-containing protein [Campylobacterota bacterium]|nr:FIST N-terminal domain-containing protein [Campylobacterota bacterium]
MQYKILNDIKNLDSIDILPTLCIVFYMPTQQEELLHEAQIIAQKFPQIDMIGCSSHDPIYNQMPYIEKSSQNSSTFIFFDMPKEYYRLHCISTQEEFSTLDISSNESVILLGAMHQDSDTILLNLEQKITPNNLFGAFTSSSDSESIFYNGEFYKDSILLWSISHEHYEVKALSTHIYEPVGFDLNITKADSHTIYEIENEPAVELIECIMGKLPHRDIDLLDYPLFISNTLYTIKTIDRKERSISFFKSIKTEDKLKIAIPLTKEKQHKKLFSLVQSTHKNAFVFLFLSISFKVYWGNLESIYLMRMATKMQGDFVGVHTYGEVSPLEPDTPSVLQNQTLTVVTITAKV